MIDSHIHLSHFSYQGEFPFLALEDGQYRICRGTREQLIQAMKAMDVRACIEPAIDIESNQRLLALAKQYPGFIFPAVGVHPTRTFQYRTIGKDGAPTDLKLSFKQRAQIAEYAEEPEVVAIGETGLDYHLARKDQHRILQKLWFIYQLRVAKQKSLPVILHIREADRDAIRILKRHMPFPQGGVCHCFNGSATLAGVYTSMGFKLGIGGSLLASTPHSGELEQAVIQTPLTSLLLETDGPYVKPDCPEFSRKQLKKARNSSLVLPAVAKRIAELKGTTAEEVLNITSKNAIQLFKLKEE